MNEINKDLSIWVKSGTTEQINDVVLNRGEFGYDTDKAELKLGDGINKFNDLPKLNNDNNNNNNNKTQKIMYNGVSTIYATGQGEHTYEEEYVIPDNYCLCGFFTGDYDGYFGICTNPRYLNLETIRAQAEHFNKKRNEAALIGLDVKVNYLKNKITIYYTAYVPDDYGSRYQEWFKPVFEPIDVETPTVY